MLSLKSRLGLASRLPSTFARSFHFTSLRSQEHQTSGSLYGEITDPNATEKKGKKPSISDALQAQGEKNEKKDVTIENDRLLQQYIGHEPTPNSEKYLSPLKLKIYNANVSKNGFFKNKDTVEVDGEKYQLELSKNQIEVLEPSIYLRSFRIKHSVKKATTFLKLINRMNVKKALTQAHFNRKLIAREVAELLEKGLKDAEQLNLNPNELYLDQIWAGKDGGLRKRLDAKARGRTGIIEHQYIHLKAILKGEQTKKRLAYEKEQKALRKTPYIQLPSESLRWRPEGFYKW